MRVNNTPIANKPASVPRTSSRSARRHASGSALACAATRRAPASSTLVVAAASETIASGCSCWPKHVLRSNRCDVFPIGRSLAKAAVPRFQLSQVGTLDGELEPTMDCVAQRDVSHRKALAADETPVGQSPIENLPGIPGLLHRRVDLLFRNDVGRL